MIGLSAPLTPVSTYVGIEENNGDRVITKLGTHYINIQQVELIRTGLR